MEKWLKLSHPPEWALKTIGAGRLKGKTDINPQWRYKAITEAYGACGIGWKYELVKLWKEPAANQEEFCFAEIKFYFKEKDAWSDPIPGVGGSKLIQAEREGLHSNDEGYKMAITDALSVALKMIGVGSSIYEGGNHDSKYEKREPPKQPERPKPVFLNRDGCINVDQITALNDLLVEHRVSPSKFCEAYNGRYGAKIGTINEVTPDKFLECIDLLNKK